jgi:predicted Holliday junction resolvase-like endonuclease
MEKLNFLPLWEIERIDKRKRKNSYVFLLILIFCNSLLVIFLIFNMNNIQRFKNENTYKIALNNKNSNDRSIQNEKKIDSLKSYQWYNEEISNKIMLKEMIIKNKEIIIRAKVKDYNDYINIVSYIENKCRVKDVSIAKFDENYLEFSLILEANYE